MIKLLLFILLGFVLYSFISNLLSPSKKEHSASHSDTGETMVEDPQCKTFLPESEAIKATIKGQTHFFCSKKCLKEYKRSHH